MKPLITPTSPKAHLRPRPVPERHPVEALYQSAPTITQPSKPVRFWLLTLIAILAGALAGIGSWIGITVIHARYPTHPLWNRLGILSILEGETVTVRYVERSEEDARRRYDTVRKSLEAIVVELYDTAVEQQGDERFIVSSSRKGAGLVISNDGIIVSSLASVDAAKGARVLTSDRSIGTVTTIGDDMATSLRFSRYASPPQSIRPAQFTQTSDLFVGQQVALFQPTYAAGGGLFAESTVIAIHTAPSGEGEPPVTASEVVQPQVRLGNVPPSFVGAAVATMSGNLIGFLETRNEAALVVPLTSLQRILPAVLKDGVVDRPYLGVSFIDLAVTAPTTPNAKTPLTGALLASDSRHGLAAVQAKSPAASGGLVENDLILAVDNEELTARHSLADAVLAHDVGQSIVLTVQRDGQERSVQVTLGRLPSPTMSPAP